MNDDRRPMHDEAAMRAAGIDALLRRTTKGGSQDALPPAAPPPLIGR